jgi:hypothetical protein
VKHIDRVFRGFVICAVTLVLGVLGRGCIEIIRMYPLAVLSITGAITLFYGVGLLADMPWGKNKS